MNDLLRQFLQAAVQLAVYAAVFVPLERFFALRQERVLRKEFWNDLGYYFLNGLGLSALLTIPVTGLALLANRLVPQAVVQAAVSLPFWLSLPLAIVIGDIGAYWGHRLSHKLLWLWRFHVVHHSPTHVDWLVNTRAHPIDLVFTRLMGLAPLFALGLAQARGGQGLPALLSLFMGLWSFVIHANVRWRFGWLEYLIATPAFHHWHHTNDEHRDRNFAAIFPFIDMMFGTFWLPKHFPPVYGVDKPPVDSFVGQLVDPLLPMRRPAAPIKET
ncbi:sterol desaturase family protein [Pelomonas sp. KK5]|uniref:sterol desaturase family protein n=1 Tax=Pelomonas sp. KK5 TaxID=1855730 RepID=UPI00097C7C9C|nr:sterol desaturase family protein [Pelomonas sp. KK5]